jgi:hypothetical protein
MATKKKPKWALWRNRPAWAKPLDARLWRHLVEDAFNPGTKPTLAGVKRNLAHHRGDGTDCFECRAVGRRLGLVS